MRLKADLVLLIVAVLWGSAFAAQRIAGLLGSVYYFNAARFLLAGILLLPLAARAAPTRRMLGWGTAAGVILFAASALQQAGLKNTSAGNAGFLTSLYVVIVPLVMLVGWRVLPRPLSIAAIVLAAAGAYLLSAAGPLIRQEGDLLELGGAALWAVHVVLLGKIALHYNPTSFSATQLIVASALNWIFAALMEPVPLPITGSLVAAIGYTAVASLALGYTLQVWAQRHTPPTDAAIILSLESVFAALAGGILLQEILAPMQVLGCATIVVAVLVSQAETWGRQPGPMHVNPPNAVELDP